MVPILSKPRMFAEVVFMAGQWSFTSGEKVQRRAGEVDSVNILVKL